MAYTMQEIHVTFNAEFYEDQDRYIILDEEGYDIFGEHYSFEEATEILTSF